LTTDLSQLVDLCQAPANTLADGYATGKLSPVEVVGAALQRAETIDATLNAFALIDREGALSAARASELRWRAGRPLSSIDGVPTSLKDIVQCRGLDVRYGSRVTQDISAEPDAPSVARLRQAGAIFLGLTLTPEFGWKAVTDNRKHGITRNPWNSALTPGGSSGGAAVAAATGAGVLHLGTDGGGSIRIPASFTGIVGHKPSFGRVAAYPASAFGTVAHIGPMARTVADTIAMLNVMSGRDLRDWTQPVAGFADIQPAPSAWSDMRIGYWKTPCLGGVDPVISTAVEAALSDLEYAGATVSEIALPNADLLLETFYRHWFVGAANRFDAVDPLDQDLLDPGFLATARKGRQYSAVQRMQAEAERIQFGARMDALLDEFDIIVSPTVPILPFTAGNDIPPGSGLESWVEWSSFSFPINLSQQPACSVPCGFSPDGLPIGLQIVGPRGGDATVLGAALAYEHMYPDRFLRPGGAWPATERGEHHA
jgi:aspartyl-tRNA(Asn)/glutamyl-tRNA(Gln) amidotransferase subunit A